jgi:hypothetical protein
MKKLGIGIGVVCMVGLGVWILVGYVSVAGVEEPKYTVVETKSGYEVREYPAQIAAEVTITAEYKEALNDSSGFTVRFMNSHPTNWYLDSCSA